MGSLLYYLPRHHLPEGPWPLRASNSSIRGCRPGGRRQLRAPHRHPAFGVTFSYSWPARVCNPFTTTIVRLPSIHRSRNHGGKPFTMGPQRHRNGKQTAFISRPPPAQISWFKSVPTAAVVQFWQPLMVPLSRKASIRAIQSRC